MENVDFALIILFTNYKWNNKFRNEIQKATEVLIKYAPAVGVIKINCYSLDFKTCDDFYKKENLDTILEDENEEIPKLFFAFKNNSDSNNQTEYENIYLNNNFNSEDLINTIDELVLLKRIPFIIPYNSENYFFITIFNCKIQDHFVLLYNDNEKANEKYINDINAIIGENIYLLQYKHIAEKFRNLKRKVWFTYMNASYFNLDFDNDALPLLFFYEHFNQSISQVREDFIFDKSEINFEFLNEFYLDYGLKNNFTFANNQADSSQLVNMNKTIELKHLTYSSVIHNDNYFVVLFYKNDNTFKSSNTFNKWNFLLERLNFLINGKENKLSFYKLEVDSNFNNSHMEIIVPNEALERNFCICLFSKYSLGLENISYLIYEKGPSINLFAEFLNQNIDNFNLNISEEEFQDYFQEIFYNENYLDVDMENLIDADVFEEAASVVNVDNNKQEL